MKVKALILSFFAALLIQTPLLSGYTIVQDQMPESIKTPSLSKIERVKVRLNNGLEAIIVSDPDTPKSGAALSVGVGQAGEPFHQVGLAHFVEHMLFMGTEDYPVEKEYHEFIQENGGSSNAYTSTNQTVYMYEINNDKMPEALKRFGSFFNKPLFNESGLSREMQAVDNEFTFRANMDGVRQFLVMLEMTNSDHPLHVWRCGTKETLSQISREELVEWYQANYSANEMKLAVYTSQPVNEVLSQIDQIFSSIKTTDVKAPALTSPLVNPENLGKMIYMEPIQDLKSLTIQWEVSPEYAKDLDYHTMDLVGSALAEEYPGSLATVLKGEGLIQSFTAGGYSIEDNIALFQINMELTERGIYNTEAIIGECFAAISTLQVDGIPRYRFDEMVSMQKLKYQYQSRPSVFGYISQVSASMRDEPLETYPQRNLWPTKFSKERTQEFLSALQPDQAFYCIMVPNAFLNKDLDQQEKLTKAKYTVESLPQSLLGAWAHNTNSNQYGVAPPNPYIPNNVDLVQVNPEACDLTNPIALVKDEKAEFYFAQDNRYGVPEVFYQVYINTKQVDSSAKNKVLLDIYLSSVGDALTPLADQGSAAGLGFHVGYDENFGLALNVLGYSQKAPLFLKQMVEKMKTHKANQGEFLRYKEALTSLYENMTHKQMPVQHAATLVQSILNKDYVAYEDKLQTIGSISYEDYLSFANNLYDQVYLRGVLYGNLDQNDALAVLDYLDDSFATSEIYPLSEQPRKSVLKMDEMDSPHVISERTSMEGNAALLAIGQGERNLKKAAALNVFSKAVSSPFFDTLRTKQQTGYMVNSMAFESERQLFTYFYVLTNSYAPRDLLARFELFNEDFLKAIGTDDFNEQKFNQIKGALITELQQPAHNLSSQGAELNQYAFELNGDFNRRANKIQALNDLSFEEFAEFSQTYFGRKNPRRIAALIEGVISPENALDYISIQNISNFKTQLYYTSSTPEVQNERLNELHTNE